MSPFAHQPATAKATLISFIDRAPVTHTQTNCIAQAQNLLAQIWLQLSKLSEARILCRQALDTRLRLHVNQAEIDLSYALLSRIEILDQSSLLSQAALLKVGSEWRSERRRAYSQLTTPDKPVAPLEMHTLPFDVQIIPIQKIKPQPQMKQQMKPRPDKETRRMWLQELQLHCSPNDLEEAIISGDRQEVEVILRSTRSVRRPGEALHIAAFFGEVQIATKLLAAGKKVNSSCTTKTRGPNGICYNVTPLHLVIGAQQDQMIEFLVGHGARMQVDNFSSRPHSDFCTAVMVAEREVVDPDWMQGSQKVIGTLNCLISLGWGLNSQLNYNVHTMLRRAWMIPDSMSLIQKPVVAGIQDKSQSLMK